MKRDKYGALWPEEYEVCSECGQPDNTGDCNHKRLSNDDVWELGGIPRYFPPQIEGE